jgi:hypothetical protein
MINEEIERELGTANPVGRSTLAALDLAAGEAALEEALIAESALSDVPGPPGRAPRQRRSARLFIACAATAAAAVALFFFVGGAGTQTTSSAYGAELVRFAESTPLLLLEGPDWRVRNVYEAGQGAYMPRSSRGTGSMEFVTGPEISYGSPTISADGTVRGMTPKTVRQRKVELSWHRGKLEFPGPVVRHPIEVPVLDTTGLVNTRAETAYITTKAGKTRIGWGGPGDREMAAIWKEGGYTLELRAWVSNLSAFEERLGWLRRVDSETWLDAMPPRVVKAADHDAAVRAMLKGIPVPKGFKPSRIPDEGLTTDRYQVGASVTGIVSCLWFRQWGEARGAGDRAAAAEAERAMASSKSWPVLREMAKDGAYPSTIWELAREMPSGHWTWAGRQHPLLPRAEGLGCARWGIPVLPWKQRRQSEREDRPLRSRR